jgi:hypothetical protein
MIRHCDKPRQRIAAKDLAVFFPNAMTGQILG